MIKITATDLDSSVINHLGWKDDNLKILVEYISI